jgi:Kef-type K+ transport system membrane component KefB
VLYAITQVGLAIYMFIVGMEFRVDILARRIPSALAISISGMVTPFIFGLGLGWYFHGHTDLFPSGVNLSAAMLFLGVSMCITAFPVLARIIDFKKLKNTMLGTVTMGAGAINDAVAWCLLAVVLASFDGHFSNAFINIAGGVAYTCVALLLVRPLLAKWAQGAERRGRLSETEFAMCLVLMMIGAWFTDFIGLHAVFGAFILGVAMPRGFVVKSLIAALEPLTVGLLLPLFFAYSGLNTKIGLLNTGSLWVLALIVLAAAILGKVMACWLAALRTGLSNRDALGVGALMNTRGLMELIILNIGLHRGVISPALFAILVIMAIVTTLMTCPLFDWFVGKDFPTGEPAEDADSLPSSTGF